MSPDAREIMRKDVEIDLRLKTKANNECLCIVMLVCDGT